MIGEAERQRRRSRARARLRALGLDPDTTPHERIRQVWEQTRAAYLNQATVGLHLNPIRLENDPMSGACLHARFGVLRDSLADFYGAHPEGWSSPRIDWPGPGEQPAPTINVTQAGQPTGTPGPRTAIGR